MPRRKLHTSLRLAIRLKGEGKHEAVATTARLNVEAIKASRNQWFPVYTRAVARSRGIVRRSDPRPVLVARVTRSMTRLERG